MNPANLKLLSIGSDKNLFKKNSYVRQRVIEYGSLVEEHHIIVFCKRGFLSEKIVQIAYNVFLHPTNSSLKWLSFWDAAKIGKKLINKGNSWLIMTQDPFEAGLAGFLIKKKRGAKLQIQVHGDFLSPYFGRESILNRIRVLLAKFLLPKADGVRVVSERIKQSLKNYKLKSEPLIFPIFVDIKKIQTAETRTYLHQKYPQFNFIILMASRLTKEKNIGMAIEAMSEIIKSYSKIGLIIVGEGKEEKNLKLKVKDLKLSDNIIFESWNNDLPSYYKTADLFLLTSNHEGYGMSVVEAMASGCPLIMTDVGCAREVVKNETNGLIIHQNNKPELIKAIKRMIKEPSLRGKLKNNGLETIKNLSTKEEYLDAYKKSWDI